MTTDDTFDVMGGLDGVKLDSGTLKQGDYPCKIVNIGVDTTKNGWKRINVELVVANGDFEGKKMFTNFNWAAPTDGEGNITPSEDAIGKKMEKTEDWDEAVSLAIKGYETAVTIGKQGFKRLMNGAGFIDMKDTKPGDSNLRRIEAGLASEVPADFTIEMLVGKYVMVRTKAETNQKGNTYQVPKTIWDVDPEKVGDLAESVAF